MKSYRSIIILSAFISLSGCVTKFMPEVDESRELLVVEGMITDQPETNRIRLTKSSPLDRKNTVKPVTGCTVSISDDLGNNWMLKDAGKGYYITDSLQFQGVTGRKYTLKVNSNGRLPNNYTYESQPTELIAVPPIDDLYYERKLIEEGAIDRAPKEGCYILLNTHDERNSCNYYRWDFTETWEIKLPYDVTNRICWVTNKSSEIMIKNTGSLSENSIKRLPVNFVSNESDRLGEKYSILVNQYSMTEDEYNYWKKMQLFSEQTGTLYDIIPTSVQGNIYCNEDPGETVLGYFSVSAKSSRRIFVDEFFNGQPQLYTNCPIDTVSYNAQIPGLGTTLWIIVDAYADMPPYKVLTDKKGCSDCTVRGTTVKPSFWDDDKLFK